MLRKRLPLIFVWASLTSLPAAQPNIVFIFSDDQRADTIAAHGNEFIQTPHLDRLAATGLSFTRNYCAGSYTGAVCAASRSMLMTGIHWQRIKDIKNWTGLKTLPERLADSGYTTFITGKWHNGEETLKRAFQAGERVHLEAMSDHTRPILQDLNSNGTLTPREIGDRFSSTYFADTAVEFIEEYENDAPYFLYVAFTAPHDPRNPPPSYRELYYREPPPLPKNFFPDHPFHLGKINGMIRDESLVDHPRPPEHVQDQLSEYYGLITQMDTQIGRVLDAIEMSGQAENTLIIFSSDQGLALGSHGLMGKQNVYEHSMRSPLIVVGPGISRGNTTQAMTYILDLHKTILSQSGAVIPKDIDGEDLSPVFADPNTSVRSHVFLPFMNYMRTARDDRYKLHVYPYINHRMLFDLTSDPHEMNDLIDDPAYDGVENRLTSQLLNWQNHLGDTQTLSVINPEPKDVDYSKIIRRLDPWQPGWVEEKYFSHETDLSRARKRYPD